MSILMDNVLILNRSFLAVQVSIARDAITALANGKARVVDENYRKFSLEDWISYSNEYKSNPQVVNQYTGFIRSPSIQILSPQVIIFPDCEYTSPLIRTVKYSRRNIYSRDGNKCQYCLNKRREFKKAVLKGKHTRELLTLDHVQPRSRGGPSSWTNVVTCCKWCNAEKGNMLLEELGWKIAASPKRPKWQSHIGIPFNKSKKKYWEKFLG